MAATRLSGATGRSSALRRPCAQSTYVYTSEKNAPLFKQETASGKSMPSLKH